MIKLFGPVLRYDLVCTARRTRYFVMRFFFALILFLTLYVFYVKQLGSIHVERVSRQRLVDFAEIFSYAYLIIQYLLVLLLTPSYVGTAIAEEKERRTLEFLLTTDLKSQEIIFGKLASRVGNIIMFLLAGLPVLSFVQFFGGIDPDLLLYGFLATLMTVLSVAAISMACSVQARHSREGIIRSYMIVIGYFIFGFLLSWLIMFLKGFAGGMGANWKLTDEDWMVQGLCYFTEYYLTGDIFHAIYLYFASAALPIAGLTSWTGVNLAGSLSELIRNYLLFHLVIMLWCLLYSIRNLRRIFIQQVYGETRKRKKHVVDSGNSKEQTATNIVQKPVKVRGIRWPLGNWAPMIWKEWLLPRQTRKTLLLKLLTGFSWACFLFPVVVLLIMAQNRFSLNWSMLSDSMNVYVRVTGTLCMCLMILGTGIRAANSITVERDKQTLESLLLTPLTVREILFGKWFGAWLGFNSTYILLSIIWILGLVFQGLEFSAMLKLILVFLIYNCFAASLGCFFSAALKSTTRALLSTIFWLIIWLGAHWVFVGLILLLTSSGNAQGLYYFMISMTPPVVLGFLAHHPHSKDFSDINTGNEFMVYIVMGLAINLGLSLLFFLFAQHRFYRNSGRVHNLN